jgi:hypothetical protein
MLTLAPAAAAAAAAAAAKAQLLNNQLKQQPLQLTGQQLMPTARAGLLVCRALQQV